jgi:hypothetical protein
VEDRETGRPGYVRLHLALIPPAAPWEPETLVASGEESVQKIVSRLRELQRQGSFRVRLVDPAGADADILVTLDRE